MPMEGDFLAGGTGGSLSGYQAPYAGPEFAAPSYVSPEQRWATQARADEASIAAALKNRPTFVGGPTSMNITPVITGGYTGTAGPEGDRSYTPQVFEGYRSYDPATRMQYGWSGTGQYLGSQYIPKDDAWSGVKDFVKGFVLPAVGMYTGVNALGGLFGAGGALGSVSGATQAAAQQATAADIAGGMVPEFASNSAYDAAVGAAGMAPETLPSIFADTTAPLTPATDVMLPPSQSASMAAGNEAVASGMSPGSLGAQTAANNALLDSQVAAAYGTADVANLTGATAAEAALGKSVNEAVASGMSPGSVGAAQAAAGTLTPAELAAAYGTTGAFPSLPSVPSATESSFPSLTEGQFASILKALPGLLGGALGAAVMPSASSATRLPAYQPASTMPQYSPEYFQQIQQRYNQIMPSRPADVATPLSQWYNKPADSSVVTKLFGVI